jgi:hypothetical protein
LMHGLLCAEPRAADVTATCRGNRLGKSSGSIERTAREGLTSVLATGSGVLPAAVANAPILAQLGIGRQFERIVTRRRR